MIPTRSKVAKAETGSLGATIAPSSRPSAQPMPGTTAWATAPTASIVASGSPSTSHASGPRSASNSLGEE